MVILHEGFKQRLLGAINSWYSNEDEPRMTSSALIAAIKTMFPDNQSIWMSKHVVMRNGQFYEILNGDTLPIKLKPVRSAFKQELESIRLTPFIPKVIKWEYLQNEWCLFHLDCNLNYFYGYSHRSSSDESSSSLMPYRLQSRIYILIHPDLKHYYVVKKWDDVRSFDFKNTRLLDKYGFSSLMLEDYLTHRNAADPYVDLLLVAGLPEHLNELAFKLLKGLLGGRVKGTSMIDLDAF